MCRFDVNIQLQNYQKKRLLRQQPFYYRKGGGGLGIFMPYRIVFSCLTVDNLFPPHNSVRSQKCFIHNDFVTFKRQRSTHLKKKILD
jgi:hypothetical protein